jgi:Domain of unknown function (DUF4136)
MKRSWRSVAAPAIAAALLSGCSTYMLDNNVQSFSGLQALPPNPTYSFERLPSQANQPSQSQVESLADPALFQAGLRRDDAAPRYTVQVSARVQRVLSPWYDPWDSWGWGGFGWHHRSHFGFGGPFPRMEQPWFVREVGIVMREKATNRVVYETRAASDGPWLDNGVVLPAMFSAALQGFPNPPQGVRKVNIQLGGQSSQTAAAPAQPGAAPAASPAAAPAPAPNR